MKPDHSRMSAEARADAEACLALARAMANGDRSDQAASFELADFAGKLAWHVLRLTECVEHDCDDPACPRHGDDPFTLVTAEELRHEA